MCSSSPLSPLRQHQADRHHLVYEQRLLTDRGQGVGPLPLHQNPGVPALRPEAGVQGGPHQGGGHHHQGNGLVAEQGLMLICQCLKPKLLNGMIFRTLSAMRMANFLWGKSRE